MKTGTQDLETDVQSSPTSDAWIACGQLTLAMLVIMAVLGFVGYQTHGGTGLQTSLIAGAVCWLGALLALITTACSRTPERAIVGVLGSMIFRIGFPLLALLILRESTAELKQDGLLLHLLGYYLAGLCVETLLAVKLVRRMESGQKAN